MNPPFLLESYLRQLQNAFFQAFYHTMHAGWVWYALLALILFVMECVQIWFRRHSVPPWWTTAQWIVLTTALMGFVANWMSQVAQHMLI